MTVTKARKSKAAIPVGETIVNDETKVFTDPPRCTRQGDLYLVKIATLPKSAKPRSDRQLADGTTQGSRHVCRTGNVFNADPIELQKLIHGSSGKTVETQYIGPVFESPAYVEHPEHGDHDFQCDGVFAVVVQRSLDAEERAQRVQD